MPSFLSPAVENLRFIREQLAIIVRSLRHTKGKRDLILLLAGIVVVILGTAVAQVRLNAWNQPFYDAIERKDLPAFFHQLWIFFAIAAVLLVLNVAQTGVTQMIALTLRDLATRDLIGLWMSDKRAARIAREGEIGRNPDQRMHADTQHLADVSTGLLVGFLQSAVLLVSFIGVLWILSRGIVLQFNGTSLQIPGYMVWAALLYACLGSGLSWLAARPIVRQEATHYAREAEMRITFVRGVEQADAIALTGSEADTRRRLEAALANVMQILKTLVLTRVRLTVVTAGYGWVGNVVPIIVAAPGYFSGSLTFGELMVVAGAFRQVQGALGWFVSNTDAIADWRATMNRVMEFRRALLSIDGHDQVGERIEIDRNDANRLVMENLEVHNAFGRIRVCEPRLEIAPGERVLLLGRPHAGKSTLFNALAGLWDRGSGQVLLPADNRISYMAQRPYLPSASLREVLSPSDAVPDDRELVQALTRVDLAHLAGSLDQVQDWEEAMPAPAKVRLGYAQLLLERPLWIVSDDGLAPGDEALQDLLLSILSTELAQTAVIDISDRRLPSAFFDRIVRLASAESPMPRPAPVQPAATGATA
ncbi:ABC transporter ATP-binding protein/permease [Tabrizicola sp. J26]|uniref:ABC transporter ATP-binding protein/permease n=1 Tax=Alitabrizicola rongguiensis TaxID=2909234 RepID=UPI001F368D33|nr:ABC transporter ATP-binding protein/permease [Tabrizicola rongguiensis]MCF1709605.1 ABC transporter ATP-binding protein/permease [Tabrizicola rongguiensis]